MANYNTSSLVYRELLKFFTILLVYLVLSYFLSNIIFVILFPNVLTYNNGFYRYFITIIIVLGSVEIIGNILIFIATIIIYNKTKYIFFIVEGLTHLFSGIVILLVFVIMVKIQSFMAYLPLFLTIPNATYILMKKPLIWDTPYNRKNNFFLYSSRQDILLRQSSFINQFQDGYTSRPYIFDFSDIFKTLDSTEVIKRNLIYFAKFLSVNGDLIGYSNENRKINLYLRTAFIQKTDILNPIALFIKILHVIKAKDISTITFDLESQEISFKLNKSDYSRLNDITYHQFVERILKQIKFGFEKFCEGKYVDSYEEIMPSIPRLNYSMIQYYILAFIGIRYVIGGLTVGLSYFYYETIVLNQDLSYTFVYIIGWPFFTYFYFQNVFDIIIGKPDINNLIKFIPQVIMVNVLAIFLTCVVFYLIFKIYKRKLNDPMKGIKIPKEILNQNNPIKG